MGTPMVFVRLTGCNLWSGREAERAQAVCSFCDTDFVGGDRMSAEEMIGRIAKLPGPRWVCFTGGEPTLQLDVELLQRLRERGYRIALETNGTLDIEPLRSLLDWICVSPKSEPLAVSSGDELKLVYRGQSDEAIRRYEALAFTHFLLQPEWGERYQEQLSGTLAFLQRQARWRLSLQTHKLIGLR